MSDAKANSALSERNFTVVSATYRDPKPVTAQYPMGWKSRCEQFVVMTPFKREARAPALAYATERWGEPHEIHLYPRNYVQLAGHLISVGRVVEVPDAA